MPCHLRLQVRLHSTLDLKVEQFGERLGHLSSEETCGQPNHLERETEALELAFEREHLPIWSCEDRRLADCLREKSMAKRDCRFQL